MAIAFDTSIGSKSASGATSLTYSYTTTGSDVLLIVNVLCSASGIITGVTFNGVSMFPTTHTPQTSTGVGKNHYFYLIGAGATTANIVVSASASTNIFSCAASYTGVKQYDANGGLDSSGIPATDFSESLNTTNFNTWTIWCINSGAGNSTAGANTTSRISDANGLAIMDSNTNQASPGTVTLNSHNVSTNWSGLIASFSADATAVASTTTVPFNSLLISGD